jgi:hypothetical protein
MANYVILKKPESFSDLDKQPLFWNSSIRNFTYFNGATWYSHEPIILHSGCITMTVDEAKEYIQKWIEEDFNYILEKLNQ